MSISERQKLSAETWRAAHDVSTASVTSQLLKRGYRNTFLAGVKPLRPDLRLVGYALTLRYVPAREDLGVNVHYNNKTNIQRVAVESVEQDDVLVIDARGELVLCRSATSSQRAWSAAGVQESSPTARFVTHPASRVSASRRTAGALTPQPPRFDTTQRT